MYSILIVEDEASIADTIVYALRVEGFEVTWLSLASAALDCLREKTVDLLILDVGLPDMSGFELCKAIRRFTETPVIFLTARGEEIDRVVGLEIGADDYVVKPFSPRELTARVKAILKRVAPRAERLVTYHPSSEISASSIFIVDDERLQIRYRNQPLSLTRQEFQLLKHLLSQPDRVYSRGQLLEALGVTVDANYERSIDSHIKSVRAKLRAIAPDAEPIQTHRGFGYSYNPARS